jgi:hypothetical protein
MKDKLETKLEKRINFLKEEFTLFVMSTMVRSDKVKKHPFFKK